MAEAAPASADFSVRLAAAQRVAREARRGLPQLEGPQRTAHENPNFLSDFFSASRLHLIGSWKERFQKLLDTLPKPPPLPQPLQGSSRVIAHVDMDCFFASVAMRGRPELQGFAVAVAWSSSESGAGEIASCNYLAREKGVKNGMWVARAKELCEHLILMPYEFEEYTAAADLMYRTVFDVTPHVMGVSVDECFADLTGAADPDADVARLRVAIQQKTGCTASVGVGPNRLLARLATKRAKPDGYFRLSLEEGRELLLSQPVNELPGVGHGALSKLEAIGVATCADVLSADPSHLAKALGPKVSATLRAFAAGKDPRPWEPRPVRKSVGAQSSWGVRFATAEDAHTFAQKLSEEVATRLKSQGLRGSHLTLKIWRAVEGAPPWRKGSMGHGVCDNLSRSLTLPSPTCDGVVIATEARKMLTELRVEATALRGMGISIGKLGDHAKGRAMPAQVARAPPASKYNEEHAARWSKWAAVSAVTTPSKRASEVSEDQRAVASASGCFEGVSGERPRQAPRLQIAQDPSKSALPATETCTLCGRSAASSYDDAECAGPAQLAAAVDAMKETLRSAFLCGVLPVSDPSNRRPADLLALMTEQLVAAGPCCRVAAIDAADMLVRFARELGMSALLVAASEDGPRLGLSASSFVDWLADAQSPQRHVRESI